MLQPLWQVMPYAHPAHWGACFKCGAQFLSDRDLVCITLAGKLCDQCFHRGEHSAACESCASVVRAANRARAILQCAFCRHACAKDCDHCGGHDMIPGDQICYRCDLAQGGDE